MPAPHGPVQRPRRGAAVDPRPQGWHASGPTANGRPPRSAGTGAGAPRVPLA